MTIKGPEPLKVITLIETMVAMVALTIATFRLAAPKQHVHKSPR